ncbi:MAG: response regulator [Psychrosphaera sp.]|nr:response regulator [Psychrosphaera sp.]
MKDETKSKKQLIEELNALRQQIAQNPNNPSPATLSQIENDNTKAQLLQSNEQLTNLLMSLPVITYAAKASGDFGTLYISEGVKQVTGYTQDDFISNSAFWVSNIHPSDVKAVLAGMDRLFRTGYLKHEYRFKVKDGRYRWFGDVLRLIKGPNGENDHLTGIWEDITERKQLEAKLRQSSKMEALGTLAGGIAHDFNNILAAILGNAEMGKKLTEGQDRACNHLDNIFNSAERAAKLVKQILAFSRMESTVLKPTNLSVVIGEALKIVASTTPTNITLKQQLLVDCPTIMADSTQIYQIILNLCNNAYHAMEDITGQLSVTLTIEQSQDCALGHLNLGVEDTGCGISKADQEWIFDPYFTTKEVGKGTGLGLAMVFGLVEQHEGKISMTSNVGQGTNISIAFPVSDMAVVGDKGELIEVSEAKTNQSSSKHILIVEDELAVLRLHQEFLLDLGYLVTTCENGKQALALFETQPQRFDLVLTDQAMPLMTGKQLAKRMLSIRPEVPIIITTGYSDVINEEQAKAIGIRQYLVKPVALDYLKKQIERCLQG